MTLETLSENRSFGGTQGVYRHRSQSTGTDMTFAVFMPELVAQERVPVLWYLSGLTCTHDNAMTKAAAQQWCAEAGIAIVFPDTSPRGDDVADDDLCGAANGQALPISEPTAGAAYSRPKFGLTSSLACKPSGRRVPPPSISAMSLPVGSTDTGSKVSRRGTSLLGP